MNSETLVWIEEQKPALVQAAEKYVTQYEIFKPGAGRRGPRKKARVSASQLRNLLNAAQTEGSLAVLLNFLRYQIGRGRQGWEDQRSGNALLEMLQREVGERAEARDAESGERYRLEVRLAALLVGYLIRDYTFRCSQEGTSSYD